MAIRRVAGFHVMFYDDDGKMIHGRNVPFRGSEEEMTPQVKAYTTEERIIAALQDAELAATGVHWSGSQIAPWRHKK